jgi:hypothetical protein
MPYIRIRRSLASFLLLVAAGACAAAPSPWRTHDVTADVKARAADASAVCPVVFSNETGAVIEAGYVSLGVESPIGMIPSGHSLELAVSCKQERIEAFAVTEGGLTDGIVRYRKLARLDLTQVTRLDITAADRVH